MSHGGGATHLSCGIAGIGGEDHCKSLSFDIALDETIHSSFNRLVEKIYLGLLDVKTIFSLQATNFNAFFAVVKITNLWIQSETESPLAVRGARRRVKIKKAEKETYAVGTGTRRLKTLKT